MKDFEKELQEITEEILKDNPSAKDILIIKTNKEFLLDILNILYKGDIPPEVLSDKDDDDDCDCEDCCQDYDPEDFTMGFETALLSMKDGYTVRRKAWQETHALFFRNGGIYWESTPSNPVIYKYEPDIVDITATDWNIVHYE